MIVYALKYSRCVWFSFFLCKARKQRGLITRNYNQMLEPNAVLASFIIIVVVSDQRRKKTLHTTKHIIADGSFIHEMSELHFFSYLNLLNNKCTDFFLKTSQDILFHILCARKMFAYLHI